MKGERGLEVRGRGRGGGESGCEGRKRVGGEGEGKGGCEGRVGGEE